MPKISIIIPCYRSGGWLDELVTEIIHEMNKWGRDWDMWLIDDASPDGGETVGAIREISEKYSNISGVELQFNAGQTGALLCGYSLCNGDYVVSMSDDFQNPPSEIQSLFSAIEENTTFDCIFGKRVGKSYSLFRTVGSRIVSGIYRNSKFGSDGVEITGFFIMKRKLKEALIEHNSRVLTFGPLILQSSSRLMDIEVGHSPRKYGKSGYGIGKLLDGTLDIFVNSGISALRIFTAIGLILSLASFSIGGFYVYRFAIGETGVSGFTTIVTLITFFSGVIMLMFGILFEYITRIVTEVSRRPKFHIKEVFTNKDVVKETESE